MSMYKFEAKVIERGEIVQRVEKGCQNDHNVIIKDHCFIKSKKLDN